LLNDTGVVVKTLKVDGKDKDADNSVSLYWSDRTTDDGAPAKAGTYTINIVGQDTNPDLYAFVQNTVQGVQFTDGGATVTVGGKELPIGNIMDVTGNSTASQMNGISGDSALSLLGKNVRMYQYNVVTHGKLDENISIKANVGDLPGEKLQVLDASGNVLAALSPKAPPVDGVAEYTWDCRTDDGKDLVTAGAYGLKLADENSNNPGLYIFTEGTVNGVNTAAGIPYLQVNGEYIPMANVFEVQVPKS
jgi:flagellar hook assembly protein FlgD